MTWILRSAAIAAALLSVSPALADEPIWPETVSVPLDPADPQRVTLGELTYMGGIAIHPGDEDIGGISGLEWHESQLFAVTDQGDWLIMAPDELRGKLVDVFELEMGDLLDERGKRLRRKEDADAEAIALLPTGEWLVAFERQHRVWRYTSLEDAATSSGVQAAQLLSFSEPNFGLETFAVTPDGWLACGEWQGQDRPNCVRGSGNQTEAFSIPTPAPIDELGGTPTDADCAANGVCYVLFRSYSPSKGNSAAIMAIAPDGLSEVVASWDNTLSIDNFEGLTVREEGERTFIYIVSDNNFSEDQRTLLMKFEVSKRAAATPGVPEKVWQVSHVEVETSRGSFTIALETERAPISAANFLRYVDEDRFDSTRCYRTVHVAGGKQPNGFLQCGAQNHPERILPGIAHEPTNETGLSHTNGALSMARLGIGTATGDFSIMIGDQRGLDARPDASDADAQAGYAVFGYVTGGWEVIHAIHGLPTDPEAGEGMLKGQMLDQPIEIIGMRRISPPASED